ncbi:MAG TPA: hypothetical protein VJH24_03455 [Candidatus Bilamarchaeaceae archaeon]|nr:hypothetical protein [Candidatus Bilamarchaeaceae archaeon]
MRLLLLVIFLSSVLLAQNFEWERVAIAGGEIAEIAIAPSNPNVMYAGYENNAHSLYKSTDGGNTWRRVNGGGDHTKDVAVSPEDPDKVYFAMSEPVHTTDLSVRPTIRSAFSTGGRGGETIDILSSGKQPGPSQTSFSTIEVFDKDDKIIYAAVKGGSFGFSLASSPFPEGFPEGFDMPDFGDSSMMQPIAPVLFKTTDGGNTWTKKEVDLKEINVIAIHPDDHKIIFVGSDDGIYLSKDSGNTLQRLRDSRKSVISIELEYDNPDIIYAASENEVFKSINGGETWSDITGLLEDIHRVRISRSHPNILYAATFNGVFKSEDRGETWQDKTSNLKSKNIQIVTIHPDNPDIAFIGHSSLWSSARSENSYRGGLLAHQGIYKTTDGGNTWTRSDNGVFEYNFEDVAVNPSRAYEAWVASPASKGGHKTNDAGQYWRTSQLKTMHYPMRIKYSLQDMDKIYATSWHSGGPFAISEDGGINWDMIDQSIFFEGINSGSSLYSPSLQGQIHLHGLAVDPENDNIIYAGSVHDADNPGAYPLKGSHIFKSTDGGNTWIESDEGFPHEVHTAIHDVAIDPKDTSIIYVATTKHEAEVGKGIYKSTDAGRTWRAVNSGLDDLNIGTVIIHPDRTSMLIAATEGGIYKSTNGGSSWGKKSSSSSFDVEYVIDNPNVVYASTNDGVLRSTDFGYSWENIGVPAGEGQGIGVDKTGNVIYAAVKNRGIYIARLVEVEPQDLTSEFGRGFGGFEFPESPSSGGFPSPEDYSADYTEDITEVPSENISAEIGQTQPAPMAEPDEKEAGYELVILDKIRLPFEIAFIAAIIIGAIIAVMAMKLLAKKK